MGIHGGYPIVHKNSPKSCKTYDFSEFKKVAIDANEAMYAYAYNNMENPERAQMRRLAELYFFYMSEGVEMIFVFDGEPLPEKAAEVAMRKESKEKVKKTLEELRTKVGEKRKSGVSEEDVELMHDVKRIKSLENKPIVSRKNIMNCVYFLTSIGAEVIMAKNEGEGTCAVMNRLGYVNAVVGEDMDVFAFGGKFLLRHSMSISKMHHRKSYDIDMAIADMGFTPQMFIDWCLLAGCDFVNGFKIPSIACGKGFMLIQEHKSIEKVVSHYNKTNRSGNFVEIKEGFSPEPGRAAFMRYRNRETIEEEIKEWFKPSGFDSLKVLQLLQSKNMQPVEAKNLVKDWASKALSHGKLVTSIIIDEHDNDDNDDNDDNAYYDMYVEPLQECMV